MPKVVAPLERLRHWILDEYGPDWQIKPRPPRSGRRSFCVGRSYSRLPDTGRFIANGWAVTITTGPDVEAFIIISDEQLAGVPA